MQVRVSGICRSTVRNHEQFHNSFSFCNRRCARTEEYIERASGWMVCLAQGKNSADQQLTSNVLLCFHSVNHSLIMFIFLAHTLIAGEETVGAGERRLRVHRNLDRNRPGECLHNSTQRIPETTSVKRKQLVWKETYFEGKEALLSEAFAISSIKVSNCTRKTRLKSLCGFRLWLVSLKWQDDETSLHKLFVSFCQINYSFCFRNIHFSPSANISPRGCVWMLRVAKASQAFAGLGVLCLQTAMVWTLDPLPTDKLSVHKILTFHISIACRRHPYLRLFICTCFWERLAQFEQGIRQHVRIDLKSAENTYYNIKPCLFARCQIPDTKRVPELRLQVKRVREKLVPQDNLLLTASQKQPINGKCIQFENTLGFPVKWHVMGLVCVTHLVIRVIISGWCAVPAITIQTSYIQEFVPPTYCVQSTGMHMLFSQLLHRLFVQKALDSQNLTDVFVTQIGVSLWKRYFFPHTRKKRLLIEPCPIP